MTTAKRKLRNPNIIIAALRGDRKKTPEKYAFRPLSLADVLSPDLARMDLYYEDSSGRMARVRLNGRVKTWKRDPSRVEIPVKFGLYEAFRVTDPGELYVMANNRSMPTGWKQLPRDFHETNPGGTTSASSLARNPYGPRSRFKHRRVRTPSRFVRGSFRTKRVGRGGKEIVLGRLKGSRTRTRTGRRKLTVQAVLTPKRNPQTSESQAWQSVKAVGRTMASSPRLPAYWRRDGMELEKLADRMLAQVRSGVHTNPLLAVVGPNPPRHRRGRMLGYVTGELRYKRTIGAHPGWYKHHFKTRARLLAMPDGSLTIAS
jgi:hypothetical protein